MRSKQRWVCGHKKRMIVIDGSPMGVSKYLRWSELPEPKKCYQCWAKDQKRDTELKAVGLK